MGIKYGFCAGQNFNGKRMHVGRSMLQCGSNVLLFSSGLSGEAIHYGVDMADRTLLDAMCVEDFYSTGCSASCQVQSNPVMIGCCADHKDDVGKLIDAAAKGTDISQDFNLSIQGNGTPEAAQSLEEPAKALINNVAPFTLPTDWIPTELSADVSLSSWQRGSATWISMNGLGVEMVQEGVNLASSESGYSVSVDISTGVADIQQSRNLWRGSNGSLTDCAPADVKQEMAVFATALDGLSVGV